MRDLVEKINEGLIVEAAAKNVHNPRKGSTIYLLRKGDTKAIPVKVSNVTKRKTSWYGHSGGYDIDVQLSDNEYGITGWLEPHYGHGFDYSDEKYQVKEFTYAGKDAIVYSYYAGVSKEAIQSFISSTSSKKLNGILQEIDKKQKELDELLQKKQKLEGEVNIEITESFKQIKRRNF